MEKIFINGGNRLNGKLKMLGAKNAILPILAGSILCDGVTMLRNSPKLSDIDKMCEILASIGARVEKKDRTIRIDTANATGFSLPSKLTGEIRASIFMLGPLLAKHNRAEVAYPGGCNIGNRPIDIHLHGLRALGVEIDEEGGNIYCNGKNMKAGDFYFRFPSVGATENLMMASVFLKGKSRFYNVAKEPEIVDLQNFLNKMGAKISGGGSDTITVEGVERLNGVEYQPIADRIVVGTYILACLIAGGDVELSNVNPEHVYSLLSKFNDNSCKITCNDDKIRVQCSGRLKSIPFIETMPYPGFATDLQAQMMTLQAISDGSSVMTENLFETRFKHVPELIKMGAEITVTGNTATVTGVERLSGAEVVATDLRAGASLVLAGLIARGQTVISNIEQIDRGYERIENDLAILGADIKRVTV